MVTSVTVVHYFIYTVGTHDVEMITDYDSLVATRQGDGFSVMEQLGRSWFSYCSVTRHTTGLAEGFNACYFSILIVTPGSMHLVLDPVPSTGVTPS